jgi:hypothetical protein
MTTKAQARIAAMEAERELLGTVHSINGALQGLANTVQFENEHFTERIQRIEVQLSQMYAVLNRVVAHLGEERDAGNWWKHNGDGGQP